ncbi:MAG: hypothetical protein H0U63_06795 [Burkholderiales bacterium]|nr:hypothetical protein [Burkholderiales bacterium]
MSLAKCLIDFPVGDEDLAAIRKLMGKSKDETKAVEKFARSLEKDLEGLRKQLADKGYDVEPGPIAPSSEPGAEGKPQLIIPGAEQASDAAMAQRSADAPLRPTAPQKGMETGLFGDEQFQSDMFSGQRAVSYSLPVQVTLSPGFTEALSRVDAKGPDPIAREIAAAKREGFDPQTGVHDLADDLASLREQGVLTPEEEAELKIADANFDAAVAWEDVMQVARNCVIE